MSLGRVAEAFRALAEPNGKGRSPHRWQGSALSDRGICMHASGGTAFGLPRVVGASPWKKWLASVMGGRWGGLALRALRLRLGMLMRQLDWCGAPSDRNPNAVSARPAKRYAAFLRVTSFQDQ
jgi:hypothetical protein